jgi:hypothetical protein
MAVDVEDGPMPTPEDYRQMANRSAQLAIACSAPSVAHALLALGLEYMALAARFGQPVEVQQPSAGFGQPAEMQQDSAGFGD